MEPEVKKDVSLKGYNTFGIDVRARYFAEVHDVDEVQALLRMEQYNDLPLLILGGGSNLLFTKDFEGLVVYNGLKGITVIREDEDHAWVEAGSGEIWHEVVLFCINKGYGGIENLSLIPGTIGAAPIQNIGAYGAELKDTFESLQALDLKSGAIKVFDADACAFGYRDSVFKHEGKGRFFITGVTLRLRKRPILNTAYGALQNVLDGHGIANPTVADVSQAVCAIRNSKLPDPKKIGNAGSFFKNPEISRDQYERLQAAYPDIPGYTAGSGLVKIPAGWLIERCGWRGKRVGNTGSHKDQALVLVNYGGATGREIEALAKAIQLSVEEKFGITLTPEVNIIPAPLTR